METFDLIKIVGTPFVEGTNDVDEETLDEIYDDAFKNRVALLYLSIHRKEGWAASLERKFIKLNDRRQKTLDVVASLGESMNEYGVDQYAIFKSLKPYPATPNDTDVINFGNKIVFNEVIDHLYSKGYEFHEWAPMQTTLIHPDGVGKTGKGKKGGTYYIDMYSDISTDYFLYIDKRSLLPYVEERVVEGKHIRNVKKEIELAIILFHNIFPERTFQLEHFYMPLYHLLEEEFDLEIMIEFAENQKLVRAISTNLTLVEYIHREVFGFVPGSVTLLLDRWGRNTRELEQFILKGATTPYMIMPRTFWLTFYDKLHDGAAFRSILVQAFHMLNPVFFFDVMRSLKNRFSEKGTYHVE